MSEIPASFAMAELTSSDLIGIGLGIVGAIMVLGGAYLASVLINKDPREIESWEKAVAFALLVLGFLISFAGFTATLWDEFTGSKPPQAEGLMSAPAKLPNPADSFAKLLNNARVDRLLRLTVEKAGEQVSDEKEPGSLSDAGETYILVADYDEMRGLTAFEAARRLGANPGPGDRITAIIFPRGNRRITPVNTVGLLQTVAAAEAELQTGKKLAIESRLSPEALQGLALDQERPPLTIWSWSGYAPHYTEYCKLALEFRCNKDYAARAKISDLDAPWHPLGFSVGGDAGDLCSEDAKGKLCAIKDAPSSWDALAPRFGSRVFYIKNEPLDSIDGKVLIEFDNPKTQRIPVLDLMLPSTPPKP